MTNHGTYVDGPSGYMEQKNITFFNYYLCLIIKWQRTVVWFATRAAFYIGPRTILVITTACGYNLDWSI